MKTLGDTTAWKTFLLFFLLYGTTISMAKAGDGEVANSCETAAFLEGNEQDFTFTETQQDYYVEFIAENDSLLISVLKNELGSADAYIDHLALYFKDDCENLILLDSLSADLQNQANYLSYTNYQLEGHYLLYLKRANTGNEESFKIKIDLPQLVSTCPSGTSSCYEMIKNGDFSNWRVTAPDLVDAFAKYEVCDWKAAAPTAQLIYRQGSFNNNGPLLSNPYAGLYSTVYTASGIYTEGIHTGVSVSTNKYYLLRVKLESSSLSNFGLPDSVRFWFIKESELDNLPFPRTSYLSTINNNRQQIAVVEKNQINSTFTEYTFCVRADDNYDRLLIFAHTPTLPPASPPHRFVHVDDVSLIKISDFDAGDDKTISYCDDNDVIIGPDCLIPFANYDWSPGTGLSIPSFPYPTVDPLTNVGAYTLWMDIPGTSCGGADQVTVTSTFTALPDGEDVIWGYNNKPAINIDVNTGEYVSNGETFVIEGEFEVNHNWTLNSCKLWMAEGAKIVVTNGAKFHFNGEPWESFIKTCQGRWDGIYADSGTVVQINDLDTFKNSNAGIQLAHGAGIVMSDVHFYQNAKGVTYNGNGTTTPNIFYVNQSHFRCDMPLKDGNGDYYYPQLAIELNNLYSSHAFRPTIFSNRFYGSSGAIKVVKGDVSIKSNIFESFYDNSNEPNYPGNPTFAQTAVQLYGRGSINDSLPKMFIYRNIFKDVKLAILTSYQMELIVDYNYMNADYGWQQFTGKAGCTFLLSNNNNLNGANGGVEIEIIRNRLNDVGQGILMYNAAGDSLYNSPKSVKITTNTIIGQDNYESIGVLIDNSNLPAPHVSAFFRSNKIYRVNKGIQTSNLSTVIGYNEIKNIFEYDPPAIDCMDPFQFCPCLNPPCTLPDVPGFAVKVSGPLAFSASKIQNQFSSIPNLNVEGIVIENCNGFFMKCDSILNMGQGIRFSGVNSVGYLSSPGFRSVSLIDNFNDFVLHNYGEIGVVGDSVLNYYQTGYYLRGNSIFWEKSNPNFGFHIACVKNTDGTKSDLFLGQTAYNPSRFYVDSSSTLIDMTVADSLDYYAPGTCGDSVNLVVQKKKSAPQANNQLKSLNAQSEWHDRLIARSRTIPNANRVKFEQQLGYYNYLKDTSIHSISKLKNYYDSIGLTPFGQLVSAQKMMQRDTLVRSLSASDPMDRDLRFTIRMSLKAKKQNQLNRQEMTHLETLAKECPYESGFAVYQARNILGQLGFYGFINACENVQIDSSMFSSKRKKALASTEEHQDIKLYPNPASEMVTLEWKIKGENASICLYDVLGKEIKCNQLNNEVNKHFVDVGTLTNGVFMYQLKRNGVIIKTGKIVIN